jgi:S-adenosyl methyltransferase
VGISTGGKPVGEQWFTAIEATADRPAQLDTSTANPARVYDYWLGGKDNFAADRKAAHDAIAANPGILVEVRANRGFLGRAVRLLTAEAGIRQFLDIGAGLPSGDNTHEVAQRIAPDSRVVYADNDPMVAAHARALLTSSTGGETCCLDADLLDVGELLDQARQKLDFGQPIAVMLLMLLHMIPDREQPHELVSRLMAAVPSGSYLVISHPASDIRAQSMADMAELLTRLGPPMAPRSHAEVSRFFDGLDLVEPGVVALPNWRPDSADVPAEYATGWCGVARKP